MNHFPRTEKKLSKTVWSYRKTLTRSRGVFIRHQDASVRNVNYMICTREKHYSPVWYIATTHSFRGA